MELARVRWSRSRLGDGPEPVALGPAGADAGGARTSHEKKRRITLYYPARTMKRYGP